MSPTPPTVLLDRTFIEAVREVEHLDHQRAVACYRELLDRFEGNEVRLRARADALASIGASRDLFAPVEPIHVAGQHRRAAARLVLPVHVHPDAAVTLVLMRREGIARIATLDPAFTDFELDVVP